MSETIRVVRALRSERIHVVDIPTDLIACYEIFGSGFVGAALPLATRCGSVLRGKDSAAVCMEPGTRVSCPRCARITGITAADERNTAFPYPMAALDSDTTEEA